MYYTTKNGTRKNPYVLSAKRQDEMANRGWTLCLADSYSETEQQLYDRLSQRYDDVRIYEDTTRIKGLHNIFAMCR